MDVFASQVVTLNENVPSNLAVDAIPFPSNNEVSLSSLLPHGFKMKKGLESQTNKPKIGALQDPEKTKTMDCILIIVCA